MAHPSGRFRARPVPGPAGFGPVAGPDISQTGAHSVPRRAPTRRPAAPDRRVRTGGEQNSHRLQELESQGRFRAATAFRVARGPRRPKLARIPASLSGDDSGPVLVSRGADGVWGGGARARALRGLPRGSGAREPPRVLGVCARAHHSRRCAPRPPSWWRCLCGEMLGGGCGRSILLAADAERALGISVRSHGTWVRRTRHLHSAELEMLCSRCVSCQLQCFFFSARKRRNRL